MANLVINWVNKDVRLSRVIEHPEQDLANGYLLGELLAKLNLIDDETFRSFKDSLEEDDELQNFAKICKVLKLLKVKFDERQVARIMTEQYGCAASLVVKVRDYVQEAARQRPSHHGPIKALISVRPKPWTRKAVVKAEEMDYMDRLIEQVGFTDLKSLDMALHLKRFEDLRLSIEEGIRAKERRQAMQDSAARHQSRELGRAKFGMKSAYLRDWLQRGHKDWAKNMRTQRSNFTRLLQYELCLAQSRQIRAHNSRTLHRAQARSGIEWFETNMLRLGVGGDEKRGVGNKQQASKEDPLVFLRRIRATEEAQQAALRLQVSDLMLELREKAQARRKATREKEIRRRKDMCDQNNAQASMQEAGAETRHMDSLIKKVEAEGSLWHATWTMGGEEAMREEDDLHDARRTLAKQHRAQEESVCDFFTSLADKCVLEEVRRREFNQRLPLLLQSRREAKHSKALALVADVLAQVVDLSLAASLARGEGGGPLGLSEWRRLKGLFVAGHDFFPPKTAESGNGEEDEEEARRRAKRRGKKVDPAVEAWVNAEAVVWHSAMQRGEGAWAPRALSAFSPTPTADGPTDKSAPPPEKELLATLDALLAPDRPLTHAPRLEPPPVDTPALLVAVVGPCAELPAICRALLAQQQAPHAPPLTLVALDEAIATAQQFGAKTLSDEDKQVLASSPSLQALAELGSKHLAITTDPKNPGPASDQLLAELIVAYGRYLSPNGCRNGWLLCGFPSTPLQAKLLEKQFTGYADPEVTEYLTQLAKVDKKRFGAPKEPPKKEKAPPNTTNKDEGPLNSSGNGQRLSGGMSGGMSVRLSGSEGSDPPASAAFFGGPSGASAFDAVIVLSPPPPPPPPPPAVEGEGPGQEEAPAAAPSPSVSVGLWSTFAALPPRCFELEVGPSQPAEFIAESLDLLLEIMEQRKAQAEEKARLLKREGEEGAGAEGQAAEEEEEEEEEEEWRVVLERRRSERAARLSLAACMWREHSNGGRQLCVEELEARIKVPWAEATRAYDKGMHRGLSLLTQSLRPLHCLEADSRAEVRWLVNAPLPQLASACHAFADRLGQPAQSDDKATNTKGGRPLSLPKTADGLRRFAADVEVSLGALVEDRYDEICTHVARAREKAEAAAHSAFSDAERSLHLLISAETRHVTARLRLLADFDELSNVSQRDEIMSATGQAAVAAVQASIQTLLSSLRHSSPEWWPSLTSALEAAVTGVGEQLSAAVEGAHSAVPVADMCDAASRCLVLLDGLHAFFLTFGEAVRGFADNLYNVLRREVRRRTGAHHAAVARACGPIAIAAGQPPTSTDVSMSGDPDRDRTQQDKLRASLEGLAKRGIEVDESLRVPTSLGPSLLDSGLSYLPPESISALVYALRSRASRGPLLRRDAFVKTVTETMRKAHDGQRVAWTDVARVSRVAAALDPMDTGMVAWRRFAHSLLLGLLPHCPPTLSALLSTRLAAHRRADPKPRNSALPPSLASVNPSERRPSVGPAGRRPSLKSNSSRRGSSSLQAVIRVSMGEFLDLPMWFDGHLDRKQARSLRELYALVFAEDDGRVALSHMLLCACESIPLQDSVLGPSLTSPCCMPLVCAAILLARPFRPQEPLEADELVRAFAMRVSSSGAGDVRCGALPSKVLESLLQSGTHLHTPDSAAAFVRRVVEDLGLSASSSSSEGQDVMVPLDRLLSCELLCEEVMRGGLFAVCPVYAIVEREVPETGDV